MKTTFSGWRYLWKSEDIRRKLIITFIILAIYRLAANVPAPGVNFSVLASFRASATGSGGNFLDFLPGRRMQRSVESACSHNIKSHFNLKSNPNLNSNPYHPCSRLSHVAGHFRSGCSGRGGLQTR